MQAEQAGVLLVPVSDASRKSLKRFCRSGQVVMPHRGMYACRPTWEALRWKQRAMRVIRTYALVHPGCIFCSFTAAFILGLWVPKARVLERIHVVGMASRHTRWTRVHCIGKRGCIEVDGLRVASVEQTVLDCLRDLDFRNGLALADSYLRLTSLGAEGAIERLSSRCAGYRGIVRTRDVMALADARSESGGESYARAVMLENGVMAPELQVEVARPDDASRAYRFDFGWLLPDGTRVAGELDGYEKTENPEMLRGRTMNEAYRAERLRESQVTSLGIQVARFTFPMCVQTAPLLRVLDMFRIPRTSAASRW